MTANVARAVARALEADACFVYAYDGPADELVLQAVYGTHLDDAAPLPRMRPGEGLTGYAAREREPVAITADARSDPRFMGFRRPRRGALRVAARRAHPRPLRAPARAP